MPSVFAKLNLKDQKQIVVLGSPADFESELATLKGVDVIRDLKKAKELTFSLAFVTTQEQVDADLYFFELPGISEPYDCVTLCLPRNQGRQI